MRRPIHISCKHCIQSHGFSIVVVIKMDALQLKRAKLQQFTVQIFFIVRHRMNYCIKIYPTLYIAFIEALEIYNLSTAIQWGGIFASKIRKILKIPAIVKYMNFNSFHRILVNRTPALSFACTKVDGKVCMWLIFC